MSDDAVHTWKEVEAPVEGEDPGNSVVLHDGHVERIPSGSGYPTVKHRSRALHIRLLDGVHFVCDTQEGIKSRLDRIPSLDRYVPMQDFLKNLGTRNKPLPIHYGPFKQTLGVGLVRVWGPNEIHGHVRIDEDHGSVT